MKRKLGPAKATLPAVVTGGAGCEDQVELDHRRHPSDRDEERLKDLRGGWITLAAAFARLDPGPDRYLVGALPLVPPILDRLDVAGIDDRACPMRGRGPPHPRRGDHDAGGRRAHWPLPLYDVTGWANTNALDCWARMNDDRLGRAFDAVAGRTDDITSAVALAAVGAFGIDAARLQWDFTPVAFCGASRR